MKNKKDTKLEKRSQDDETLEEPQDSKKSNKKIKINNVETINGSEEKLTTPSEKAVKSVDTNIFKYFKDLTNDEEKTRMDAALQLLQQLSRTKDEDKRQKELIYTLKRLIRGCGASTNVSRAGFFTSLVGFLKAFSHEEITMQHVFETLNKELHVGATIANKEDADAVVGKILVCGALLHSGRLTEANSEYLEQVTNILLQSTHHRTYHASLGYSFLSEIIENLSQKQFESSIWPLLQRELVKPWSKQSLQTVHCLIAVQKKYPSVVNSKFLKANFGGTELLNTESFQYLHKIFWEHSNTDILTHPAFESFGSYIATSKYLTQFWSDSVEPGLENPTKLLEIETLKILTDIFDNLNVDQSNVHELLTDNFMRMFIEGLKNLKQKKDETLKAFYTDFLESLVKCCGKLTKDTAKVAVIKRLILPPGIFNIEKFTGNRIVHQLINTLGDEGVMDVYKLYKSIFLATLAKNPENASENWLNFERLNAGYMLQHLLQHKSVHTAYKWREEQLKFLYTCGIFYVNDVAEVCKKEAAGSFSKDFADQCKNMFYTCLQTKLTDLQQEQKLLFNLAEFCQEKILQKHATKYFRTNKFDDTLQKSWKNMFDSVTQSNNHDKPNKKKKSRDVSKLQSVFNILLLNMGLQLFREPEMACPAVDDLLKCMEKTKQQTKPKKKSKKANDQSKEQEEEPEWIEVVVDLFLHLLSQNNSALRNIVNALFPHLCDNMSLSAVHQILAMLEMKDGQNPLSSKNEEEDDDDDGEEEEDEEENESEKATLENGVESEEDNDDEDDTEEDDDEDEDDEDDNDDEDGVTAADKLRNAISVALIANGTAGNDDDMDSVDLNDMTEEEGRKLDDALANAFKALKKSGGGSSQTKKSKSYRVKTTTVMHFRIRVLDLLEIYLQQKPSLLISIEIMLALFNMLEYCVVEELKPLQIKIEKVLTKLTTLKNYKIEEDLKEDNFVDFIRLIVEKKAPAVAYDIMNKMRNKCTCFLIANTYKINADESTSKILSLCQEYTQEFIKSRNPIINITLLSDIFKLRWSNIWKLAEDLAQNGLSLQTRTFRRIQIYEILSVLYRNNDLQKQNEESAKKHFKRIEKSLVGHIKELGQNDSIKHSPKEFQTLLDILLTAQKVHIRLHLQTVLTTEASLNSVQNIRKQIRLESMQMYQRFCNTFRLTVIRNTEVHNKSNVPQESEFESDVDNLETKDENKSATELTSGQKRKQTAKDLRKLKKQKKQQRLETASRGLNGGIGFTQRNGKNEDSANDDEDSA